MRMQLLSGKGASFGKLGRLIRSNLIGTPPVTPVPFFDPGGIEIFERSLACSRLLLEYGSGGSTIVAARHGLSVVSVETNRLHARAVNRELQSAGTSGITEVLYANVGWTADWGFPLDQRPKARNLSRWRQYVELPWRYCDKRGVFPDLILVDGRFRVSCVIYCMMRMIEKCHATPILLDDFACREQYAELTSFCEIAEQAGRMVVLSPRQGIALMSLKKAFERNLNSPW